MKNISNYLRQDMSDSMTCTIFGKGNIGNTFEHKQNQTSISVNNFNNAVLANRFVDYKCSFTKQLNYDASKPTAIIPIRDCSDIVTMCMDCMKETGAFDLMNVIIVDDRSTEDIGSIASKYCVSYLRVDYDSTFNFSMLCNLAAKVCHDLGNTQVIMWNADLFISDISNLHRFIEKHNKLGSTISGAKLLYPPDEYSMGHGDTQNILDNFPSMVGKWRGTIQFGGGGFVKTPESPLQYSPIHMYRFTNDPAASVDSTAAFVTGAMHMIQLEQFVSIGGYNPSLEKNFQDVDLCLILGNVHYFGKDIAFYHDESPSFSKHNNKSGQQILSDHMLYGLLHNKESQ